MTYKCTTSLHKPMFISCDPIHRGNLLYGASQCVDLVCTDFVPLAMQCSNVRIWYRVQLLCLAIFDCVLLMTFIAILIHMCMYICTNTSTLHASPKWSVYGHLQICPLRQCDNIIDVQ